ncbi:hypothetical protein IQ272_24490 [Chroococcidiopsidales cyanobacterium LEGE 13417]|nr:hypothetical protein [Chroococcidiopsidales cyanobacterium LEGE 13417]
MLNQAHPTKNSVKLLLHYLFSTANRSALPLTRGAISHQLSWAREVINGKDDKLQVIVVELDRERSLGLVVERILNIVEEPLAIADHATRSGILYLAAIQGQVTEILDLHTIVQIAYPYLLQSVNSYQLSVTNN